MATLLTCHEISKHFGTRELFEGLSIHFSDGQRIGFLGPNGAGKTTFLRILAGLEHCDGGNVSARRGARVCFLPQEDRFASGSTVTTVLAEAIADQHLEPHEQETRVKIILTKFGFQRADRSVDELSGGWRKRLALAREIIQEPDFLLMDEPTNHLDLEGIRWLEDLLLGVRFAFLAVSHDRYFLERVTNRVVELNPIYPDGYFSVSGSYTTFLEKQADYLEARQAEEVTLANIVRRESAFLKSHAKARRTKSKSRVDEAYRLKDELRDLSNRNAQASAPGIDFDGTGRKSKKLLDAKGLAKTLGGKLLFKDASLLLAPGSRVGILGSNGSGKTTMIRTLTGDLPPDAGTIDRADDLKIVLFDQQRESLPQDLTLREALAGKNSSVDFRGRTVHISAWAKQFLFAMDQLDMPVGELSGGEQARILIARLMLRPADLLILDEPTNDLDIPSLDVLERSLTDFSGAIVLVTHDRYMLDRICTEILGLNEDGRVGRYVDCAQWQEETLAGPPTTDGGAKVKAKKAKASAGRNRLSGSEKRELAEMEATIQEADASVERCRQAIEDPSVGSDQAEAQKRWAEWEAAKKQVEALYARWEELESKAKAT